MTFTLRHVIIKPLKAKGKKNIESSKRGAAFFIKVNLKGKQVLQEIMEARRQWYDTFKVLKECKPSIFYPAKISF